MKTTLDLPDDLLIEAKAVAARRRITLKDMVAHALRREITPTGATDSISDERYEIGPFGILRLRKRQAAVSAELVRELEKEADEQEFGQAIKQRGGQ